MFRDLRHHRLPQLRSAPAGPQAVEETLTFLAAWQGFCGAQRRPLLARRTRRADLDRAKAAGKCAVIMGLQNAEHFRKPRTSRPSIELGQRCAQLTYNSQNLLGTGGTDRVDGGVSDFGAEIIEAMNEVGMLVDVSHCGDRRRSTRSSSRNSRSRSRIRTAARSTTIRA